MTSVVNFYQNPISAAQLAGHPQCDHCLHHFALHEPVAGHDDHLFCLPCIQAVFQHIIADHNRCPQCDARVRNSECFVTPLPPAPVGHQSGRRISEELDQAVIDRDALEVKALLCELQELQDAELIFNKMNLAAIRGDLLIFRLLFESIIERSDSKLLPPLCRSRMVADAINLGDMEIAQRLLTDDGSIPKTQSINVASRNRLLRSGFGCLQTLPLRYTASSVHEILSWVGCIIGPICGFALDVVKPPDVRNASFTLGIGAFFVVSMIINEVIHQSLPF
jgi:hypothetical protein